MNAHKSFRSAMTWLHTWSGLTLGWVLYAIFVTGTIAYYKPEVTAWLQPENAVRVAPADAARVGFDQLQKLAPESKRWLLNLPDARSREFTVYWESRKPGSRFENRNLDATGGAQREPRATAGGEFFYRFHFQLGLPHPYGRWLACAAAMFMLVALVSGIVTHRRFFKDLFLLRLGRDGRRPWLDFHNVTAVLALPFYLLMSYSALLIFTPMVLPWAGKLLAPAKTAPAKPGPAAEKAAPKETASATDASWITREKFDLMLARVDEQWGDQRSIRRIDVSGRGTPQATVSFTRAGDASVSSLDRETLKFSGLTGEPVGEKKSTPGWGARIRGVFYGLHLAHFAGPVLRVSFFVMGLMGAAMVGTGLVMWTLKRKDRLTATGAGGSFGYGLVSRLNLAAIGGLPVACASVFWANRILPVDMAGRAGVEANVFHVTWGVFALHACLGAGRRAWKQQFAVAALAFGALPGLDLLTAGRVLDTWPRADGVYAGFTASFLLLGALFAWGVRKLSARPAAAESKGASA